MLVIFLINLVSSTQNSFVSVTKESECFYDRIFKTEINSNSFICVINCTFNSIKSDLNGGAIFIKSNNKYGLLNYIDNCLFSECESKFGSAIYLNLGSFITTNIFNSKFKQNSAYQSSGGAIYAFARKNTNNILMKNCTFNANSATIFGGSIFFSKINFSFEECFFNNNTIMNYKFNEGGAVCSTNSNASFNKCIFNENLIQSNYSKGGAISMKSYSNLSLFECIFKNNKIISEQEDSYGGAISLYNSIISCKKSSFVNNLAYSKSSQSSIRSVGGAISFFYRMNDNEILNESFIECSFTNNTAYSDDCLSYGGAILYCKSHKFEKNISFTSNELFQNLTFINNTAYSEKCSTFGGAIVYEVSILYPHQNVVQNRVFEYLNFVGNTAYS